MTEAPLKGDPWAFVLVLQKIGMVAFCWVFAVFGPQIVMSEWRSRGWRVVLAMLVVLGAAMLFVAIDAVRAWRAGMKRPLIVNVIAPASLLLVSLITAGIRALF
jgi:hypothetical protein